MKQVGSDKYTIAWFKIAECVARGEKERALGVYRLLAHSLDDMALIRKLEADILWSFQDPLAIEKYYESARMYQASNRLFEAVALFELILEYYPKDESHRTTLVTLYTALGLKEKAMVHCMQLIKDLCAQNAWDRVLSFMQEISELFSLEELGFLYQEILFLHAAEQHYSPHIVKSLLEKITLTWESTHDEITHILGKLKAINERVYMVAVDYLTTE